MIRLTNINEIRSFLTTTASDSEYERADIATYHARCRCYHIGIHWIQQAAAPSGWLRLTREAQNLVGEAGPIRATINRITKLCVQISAATNPETLYVDALPPDHASDMLDAVRSDALESAANAMIDASGLVRSARIANAERTITGLHGIGLCCEYEPVTIQTELGPQTMTNKRVRAFDFDATRLTLDPGNHSTDLRDHDYVVYSETLTVHAVRKRFGDNAITPEEEKNLSTLGQLMPIEMKFNSLSAGSLYKRYAAHSTTKAAYVHYIHLKNESGRFGTMIVVLEAGKQNYKWVNESDPTSPFGGDGLPYILLKGWHRSESRVPISDVGMMIDDQDKLNLAGSLYFQQIYNYTGQYAWITDKRFFGRRTEDADIQRAIFNRVIIGDPHPDAQPPRLQTMPEPSQSLELSMDRHERNIEEQGFRAEAAQGRTKSHVTTTAFVRTQELAELPLDDRGADDVAAYQQIIRVLLGTTINALRVNSPITAQILVRNGLTPETLGLVAESDPNDPPCDLRINQPAVRHRSRTARRQDLLDFAQVSGMQGPALRRTLARDLDQPLSDLDKHILTYSRNTAIKIMFGQQFTPLPLGPEFSDTLLEELRRAMTSQQAQTINGAVERLAQAIQLQQQQLIMEMTMMNPPTENMGAQPPSDELVLQSIFGNEAA